LCTKIELASPFLGSRRHISFSLRDAFMRQSDLIFLVLTYYTEASIRCRLLRQPEVSSQRRLTVSANTLKLSSLILYLCVINVVNCPNVLHRGFYSMQIASSTRGFLTKTTDCLCEHARVKQHYHEQGKFHDKSKQKTPEHVRSLKA